MIAFVRFIFALAVALLAEAAPIPRSPGKHLIPEPLGPAPPFHFPDGSAIPFLQFRRGLAMTRL